MIKDEFLKALGGFTNDTDHLARLWNEVAKRYSSKRRHYHNLLHLESITEELTPFKDRFASWHTIIFAIVYHDVVYNSLKNNNEEESAEFATERLQSAGCPENLISRCTDLILATKHHAAGDEETNLFTDADLAILGADPEMYDMYSGQIRLEYSFYPDFVYNPGRKKVLMHFLGMPVIYKSPEFAAKYESSARKNLQRELAEMVGAT